MSTELKTRATAPQPHRAADFRARRFDCRAAAPHSHRRISRPRALGLALLLFAAPALLLTGCEVWRNRVAPIRTLPNWVRGIYIPMFENESFEIGLTEHATRATQEEFLADGRVRIVEKRDADLELRATILEWDDLVEDQDSDEFPEFNRVTMLTRVRLYDPLVPEIPLADLGDITTSILYRSDPRSVRYVVEPEVKERMMRQLGRQVVGRTINGFPAAIQGLPEGAAPGAGPAPEAPSNFGNIIDTRTEFD